MTSSSPIVLASGQITRGDTLRVELHQPTDTPSFVRLIWPGAPSVVAAHPKVLANVTGSLVHVLAQAQVELAKISTGGRRP